MWATARVVAEAVPGAIPPTALLCGFTLAGIALGTVSGLTPGVHANAFALLVAAAAPSLPGPRVAVAAAILAAGVVHTFLDVVPALALGVPDASMAASALPGHRLVLAGRGREALRLSALGSLAATGGAVVVAVPLTAAIRAVFPALRRVLPVLVCLVVVVLFLTEGTNWRRVRAAAVFLGCGLFGLVALDVPLSSPSPVGGPLMPIFSGLFGAPVLLDAADGGGVPPQEDARLAVSRVEAAGGVAAGVGAGALVGYLPGVSAAVGAVVALAALPGRGDARRFLVATSGANSANAVFALFALVVLRTPRTGVTVALSAAHVPLVLPTLLAVTALAAAVGFALVPISGDRYLDAVGRRDPRRLSAATLCVLALGSFLFGGVVGVALFVVAAAIGLVPPRVGVRRVYLMGVLVVPLLVGW